MILSHGLHWANDEVIAFSNGEPARMTRGEMLLRVATHGAGHRGQVALLLQKNGIQPWPDRLTDFLSAENAAPERPALVLPPHRGVRDGEVAA